MDPHFVEQLKCQVIDTTDLVSVRSIPPIPPKTIELEAEL